MAGSIIWIIGVIALVWVLYDVFAVQKKMDMTHKILWAIAAVIFSIITAIVYYFVVKRK